MVGMRAAELEVELQQERRRRLEGEEACAAAAETSLAAKVLEARVAEMEAELAQVKENLQGG